MTLYKMEYWHWTDLSLCLKGVGVQSVYIVKHQIIV